MEKIKGSDLVVKDLAYWLWSSGIEVHHDENGAYAGTSNKTLEFFEIEKETLSEKLKELEEILDWFNLFQNPIWAEYASHYKGEELALFKKYFRGGNELQNLNVETNRKSVLGILAQGNSEKNHRAFEDDIWALVEETRQLFEIIKAERDTKENSSQ